MRNLFFFLTITLMALPAVGQKVIKDHVTQSAVKISDINPGAEKFGDFEKIGNAIGDAQIVMIGEQDHGDATTFLVKTQLVKYLHEKKGFNVIAFESDFWGLNYGWDKLPKIKDSIIQFIKGNIFGVWTACYACNDLLFQYIPASYQTNNPLLVTGFDPQLILSYSYANLLQKFDSILLYYQIPTRLKENYETETRPLINSIYFVDDTAADAKYKDREIVLSGILNELREKLPGNDLWILTTENLLELNAQYKYRRSDFRKQFNLRDEQMAKNLKWLCNYKFPNEKIIVWAANAHIAMYADSLSPDRKMISMGSFFTKDTSMAQRTYILGFTSYQGETGRVFAKKYSVPKPKANSFEEWMPGSYNYAFVDFKIYNTQHTNVSENFYLKGLSHQTAFKKDWTKIFDGIFFIREMHACQK